MKPKTESVTSRTPNAGELFAQRPEIQILIEAVGHAADDNYDEMVKGAEALHKLRVFFDAERGSTGLTWYAWARVFMKKNKSRDRLALMGSLAELKTRAEKQAKVRVFLRREADRQKKSRDKRKKKKRVTDRMPKVRKQLIQWAADKPLCAVETVWNNISLWSVREILDPKSRSLKRQENARHKGENK